MSKASHSKVYLSSLLKFGLSPSDKFCCIYFIESPLKMMKNACYFKCSSRFKFLSWLFGQVEKMAWLARQD